MVADGLDCTKNLGKLYPSFVPSNPGAAGRVVYAYQTHAGQAHDMTLVQPHASRTGDPLEDQIRLPLAVSGLANETLLKVLIVEQPQFAKLSRQGLPWRFWQSVAVAIIFRKSRVHDRLSDCGAADTTHLALDAVNLHGELQFTGNGKATVVARVIQRFSHCGLPFSRLACRMDNRPARMFVNQQVKPKVRRILEQAHLRDTLRVDDGPST